MVQSTLQSYNESQQKAQNSGIKTSASNDLEDLEMAAHFTSKSMSLMQVIKE